MGKRAPKGKKHIPTFSSEDEERRFWAVHDTTDYFAWDKAVQPTLPDLKPSTTSISLRLPVAMLEHLKVLANKQDVPYQSLMKVYLAERIGRERTKKAS
jgi:predicted DNA binding CopG/RHH family protein